VSSGGTGLVGSTLGKKYESFVQGLQGAGETVHKVNDTLRAGSDKFESMCAILRALAPPKQNARHKSPWSHACCPFSVLPLSAICDGFVAIAARRWWVCLYLYRAACHA